MSQISISDLYESLANAMNEDIYDALRTAIKALGGMAAVGKRMRPELAVKEAERWLSDATNRNRSQKLSPEQLLVIARWGRESGCHALMDFITMDVGYQSTKPLMLAEQLAEMQLKASRLIAEANALTQSMAALEDNPRLLAMMQAANVRVEA